MSTPIAALTGTVVQPGAVVEPSSVTDAKTNMVAKLAEVLKDIIIRGSVYHTEEAQRLALEAVDGFKKAFSNGSPLVLDHHRAALEDVSQRVPPGGAALRPSPVPAGFQLDYNQLARAILAIQQEGAK